MILNMSKNKTDWHFVIILLSLGILGITMTYISRHVGEMSMRVDQIELKSIKEEPLPRLRLPQPREEQPTMFECLEIYKGGKYVQDGEWKCGEINE